MSLAAYLGLCFLCRSGRSGVPNPIYAHTLINLIQEPSYIGTLNEALLFICSWPWASLYKGISWLLKDLAFMDLPITCHFALDIVIT